MPLQREDCNLAALAREVIAQLQLLRGERTMNVICPDESSPVSVDRDLVSRVMQNLVGNALKFTPAESGTITIHIEVREALARVAITDNGMGIPPEHQQRIFEKFAQVDTSAKGKRNSTGLGLTFCKLAVEAHGGSIGVADAPGGGSVFWFELPR